ncbi:2-oxo-tetronate isomerase [Rhizobium binxianense]
MVKFAANLTMMFTEWPFLDRFEAAAAEGFEAVEYLFPYDFSPEAIAERLRRFDLTQVMFNMPPGDWAAGERGMATQPHRFEEFKAGVGKALDYAAATGARRLHVMAGIADAESQEATQSYRRAVSYAAEQCAAKGIDVLLEPINARSMPGYFLNDFGMAERLMADLHLENVKLQYDVFHRQIIHGDIVESLRRLLPGIGHIQIASVPERHEPTGGELNFPYIFKWLDENGYDGYVGCEYNPAAGTRDGLGWFDPYRRN